MFVVCVVRGLQHDERGHWGEGYRGMYSECQSMKPLCDSMNWHSLLYAVARWRLRPGPRARARGAPCRVARCAANMAADGRRVVGGGRGTCYGTCETRAPQGRNLTVLLAAAAAESHITRKSAAPHAMAPVHQDKPHHSTDLVELRSPILWSALYPFRTHHYAGRNISCHLGLGPGTPPRQDWQDPLAPLF